jgi:hypothetical protein
VPGTQGAAWKASEHILRLQQIARDGAARGDLGEHPNLTLTVERT